MAVVWITGAHGFIGRHLARQLAALGQEVCGLGHGAWPESEYRRWGLAHWLSADVDAANLHRLVRRAAEPAVIFHLAGGSSVGHSYASPAEDFSRTVTTTARLLDWVWQTTPASRVVMVSSAAVYGAGHEEPIAEGSQLTPFSPYGHHKAMAEQLCRSYVEACGINVSIVRFFSVYGPGLQKQLLWDSCCRLAKNSALLSLGGTGEELRDWLYIDDAVRLLTQVWKKDEARLSIVNGGTGVATPVADVARLLIEAWGDHTEVSFSGQCRSGDPLSLIADTTRLAALGFTPEIALPDGIAATVAWYKRNCLP